jgi:nicotinamide riboside kinase
MLKNIFEKSVIITGASASGKTTLVKNLMGGGRIRKNIWRYN